MPRCCDAAISAFLSFDLQRQLSIFALRPSPLALGVCLLGIRGIPGIAALPAKPVK
jgi:hypothetical protein